MEAGRIDQERYDQMLTTAFSFAEEVADENGDNSA